MNRLHNKLLKIAEDNSLTTKLVGLRYYSNCEKGYFRFKTKKSFYYTDETSNRILDDEILNRFKKLVLPPAWENVWISPYENGHLQATGIDSKGRKQYRYHLEWNKIRNQSKFYRIREFAKALPKIRKKVDKDLAKKDLSYEKVLALIIKIMELTSIRIGNENYKKLYGSFGLTTLQDKHVKFNKSNISFEFVGKKGIKQKINLQSKKLANLIKKCQDIPGQELFQYYDKDGNHYCITSTDVNSYLKRITNQDFTAKDFRMWSGTIHALEAFQESEIPENPSQTKKRVLEVLDYVSSKLGNTRTVCKKYYVHPNVIDSFERGVIWNYKTTKNSECFSSSEFSLVKLLNNERVKEVVA